MQKFVVKIGGSVLVDEDSYRLQASRLEQVARDYYPSKEKPRFPVDINGVKRFSQGIIYLDYQTTDTYVNERLTLPAICYY